MNIKLNTDQVEWNQLISSLERTLDLQPYSLSLYQQNEITEIYPRPNYKLPSSCFSLLRSKIKNEEILQTGIIEIESKQFFLVDPIFFKEYQIYVIFSYRFEDKTANKRFLNKEYLKIRDLIQLFLKFNINEIYLQEYEKNKVENIQLNIGGNPKFTFKNLPTEVKEMQLLQDRLLTILESVSFGILIIDPDTFKIVEVNSAARKYIQLPKNKIIGKLCNNFACKSEWGKCPIKQFKQKVYNSERILINAKGERIPVLKTVKKVNLGGKEFIIESFIDIIEQNKARIEAEKSAKLKTAFLSNISHELRTPLNHILGFTSLVLDEDQIGDPYKEYLGIVKRSGNKLLRIIEDIVTISKIEAGHHSINENEFDLIQSIYKIYTKYQSENIRSGKGLQILFENKIGVNKFFIKADEMKITQVTENLISNAIKYTENGFVKIKLVADKSNAKIIVSDSGKGIRAQNLQYIFESFRQVETSDRKIYDGTGIGLTICKSLSNMIGGTIEVESEFGEGSSFYFNFPFNISEELNSLEIPNDISTPDLTGKSIMIVEDEKINYLYLKTLLAPTQAHLIWKQNGKEALEYFEKKSTVDLILMDMQMPVMNGYIATEEIRKLNDNVSIIALTANVLADDRQKCLNLGCNEYTTKPIQQDVLYWHLQHFIK